MTVAVRKPLADLATFARRVETLCGAEANPFAAAKVARSYPSTPTALPVISGIPSPIVFAIFGMI